MKRIPVLHPFLLALFPILFFFSTNLGEAELGSIWLLLAATLAATAVGWLGLKYAFGSGGKAGVVLAVFWVLFSSYGHAVQLLNRTFLSVPGLGSGAVVVPVYLALFGGGVFLVARTRSQLVELTRVLNVAAAFLVLLVATRIAVYEVRARRARQSAERLFQLAREINALKEVQVEALSPPEVMRNIYYIIFDAHGRSDVLKKVYGYDDSEFVEALESRGFYVASKSRCNYSYTIPSLASSLNYTYLDNPGGMYLESDYVPLNRMLASSGVSELLKEAGYRFVCLDSGEKIQNADVYMRPDEKSEFFVQLLKTTAAGSVADPLEKRRTALIYRFERIPETAEMDSPVFVFAHIMCPHRPFLFDRSGGDAGCWGHPGAPPTDKVSRSEGITRGEHIRLYRGQIEYVDKLIIKMVDTILEKSKTPPIVVLQSDHGPEAYLHEERAECSYLEERMSILNAYYLPDGGDTLLYEAITPVNTFRVVFNHYFGTELPMLPDRNYFTPPRYPWRRTDVTDEIGSREDLARFEALKGEGYFPDLEETISEPSASLED